MQRFLAIAVVTTILLIAVSSCEPSTEKVFASPVVIPLLQTSSSLPKPDDMPNNNMLCIVCHLDFGDEPLTNDHMLNGITCAHCHGKSVAHMHDEAMMTSPDVLWGRSEVEEMCGGCHKPHKNPEAVEAFRQKWLGRKRENGRGITVDSICTDCHGRHTIPRR